MHEQKYVPGKNHAPELLAPAGDPESVRAAIAAGADAVYLGFSKFNARRRARNINRDDLHAIVSFAHASGVKVYITLNTLVTDDELRELASDAEIAVQSGADGFIVQDFGAAHLLRLLFPGVELHASTQMTTHTAGQIRFLSLLGFKRVNLSRELPLDEIGILSREARSAGISTEIFVHGAYCVSYSGQCLMSSYLGGQSGNRGICFQPCRRKYGKSGSRGNEQFLFSLKDNGAAQVSEGILKTGAAAYKIEGRIKGPDYVRTAVSYWRALLDAGPGRTIPEDTAGLLETIFNRGYHDGYFTGRVTPDMFIDTPLDRSRTVIGRIHSCTLYRDISGHDAKAPKTPETAYIELDSGTHRYQTPGTQVSISTLENRLIAHAVYRGLREDGMTILEITRRHGRIDPDMLLILDTGRGIENSTVGTAEAEKPHAARTSVMIPPLSDTAPAVSPALAVLLNDTADIPILRSVLPPESRILYEAPDPNMLPLDASVIPWIPAVLSGELALQWETFIENCRPGLVVTGNTAVAHAALEYGTSWVAGPGLGVSNSYAVSALAETGGADGVFISPELSGEQAVLIRGTGECSLWTAVYGPVLLATLRACPLARFFACGVKATDEACCADCMRYASVESGNGELLHVMKRPSFRTEIYGGKYLAVPEFIEVLRDTAEWFVLDLRRLPWRNREQDLFRSIVRIFTDVLEKRTDGTDARALLQNLTDSIHPDFPWGLT